MFSLGGEAFSFFLGNERIIFFSINQKDGP
jgi:hypothetical protein